MAFGGIGQCSVSEEIRFGGGELRLISTYAAAMLPDATARAVVEEVGSVKPSREVMRVDRSRLCASRPRHIKESEFAKVATVSYCVKVNVGPEVGDDWSSGGGAQGAAAVSPDRIRGSLPILG